MSYAKYLPTPVWRRRLCGMAYIRLNVSIDGVKKMETTRNLAGCHCSSIRLMWQAAVKVFNLNGHDTKFIAPRANISLDWVEG